MLDRNGYRPNVGIILLNASNQVWWGRRFNGVAWQFPQGGVQTGESLQQAMFRELQEEVGLQTNHVRIIGRTRNWLHYNVPASLRGPKFAVPYKRREHSHRDHAPFKGQKQIWFFLRFLGLSADIRINQNSEPEFDAWCWADFWSPVDQVIFFKRPVYQAVLRQLSKKVAYP